MPEENIIPSQQPRSAVTFSILSEGEKLPASVPVLSITVQREVNRIASAILMIQDGTAASASFATSNGQLLIPGKNIEIKAGFRNDEATIFKGVVVKHSVKVRSNISMLVVECRNPAFKMTLHPHNAYFHNMTDSDIASQLCNTYNISLSVSGSSLKHEQQVQFYSSDWDFMLCRAEANAAWVITEDDKITWGTPDFTAAATLTARYGATIKDLDAEIDSRLQYSGWKAIGWDPANQDTVKNADAAEGQVPAASNIAATELAGNAGNTTRELRHNSLPENELKKWADAALQKNRLAKIRGKVKIDGTADAQPGKILTLSGTGERFDGDVMMTGIRHQIENNTWETVIQFGDDPVWHAEKFNTFQPPAGALLPPVQGLHIGIVTGLEDPEGAERIQVRMPMINATDDGAWMRLGTLDAGKNRGWVMRPELNDEVIVGFINNDPRFGVVLGKLHSSNHTAPIAPENENHHKGYISRSDMKLLFDDEKKIMTCSTPGGHKLILDDDKQSITIEDSNGNKIVLDKEGILMDSVKDVVIKAAADIKADAGANVNITAGAQLKAEGSAGAELSAGANTVIKGAMVQIN